MIRKSFSLAELKQTKGKIDVSFDEIKKVSIYTKIESSNILSKILETKIDNTVNAKEATIVDSGDDHE